MAETTNYKTVADQRGNFIQGTIGNVFLTITDISGTPITAESCVVTIQKGGNSIVSAVNADFIKDGAYAYDWIIDAEQEIGSYDVIWKYVVDGTDRYEYQTVIVSAYTMDASYAYYGNILSDLRNAFNLMLGCAQSIPVFHEEAISLGNGKTYKSTFKRWNQSAGVRIYRNNNYVSDNEDITINYFKGEFEFSKSNHDVDVINVDYNFRWFSDEQIDRFLGNSVSFINLYPPASNYSVYNIPGQYVGLLLYGAAKDAIREMLMCLQFQQPQEVFGGPDAAQKAFSSLETLKKNYEDEYTKGLEQKKFGPYPRIKIISTPEYTLPGGRSRWFRYLFGNSGI